LIEKDQKITLKIMTMRKLLVKEFWGRGEIRISVLMMVILISYLISKCRCQVDIFKHATLERHLEKCSSKGMEIVFLT
jgi:hypothetical protein